jgi:Cdc6-like AAA superfamily ATPase
MLTGAPGLGKTLAVTTVLKTANCLVISLNANITKTLREIQRIIYEKITNKKCSRPLSTQQIIRELLSNQHRPPVIVYVE